jgi:transposase-like protein
VSRPSDYTPELSAEICARLSEGESMRSVCRDESMPSARTLFNWMRAYPEFLQQYTRAKEESADALSDEMLDIADDGSNDWMERKNAEGEVTGWQVNGEHVQRSRLRVETRKWIASKLKPKKYGDKLALGGADGLDPVKIEEIRIRGVEP